MNDTSIGEAQDALKDLGFSEDRVAAALAALQGNDSTGAPSDQLLTLKELCNELKVSETTVWRIMPPYHQVGGRKRYRLAEVLEFMEDRSTGNE